MNSSSIGNSFVGVDGPVQLLAIEKVLEQLLDLGNPSRTSNQNDVIDGAFVQFIGTFIIKVAENLKLLS